VPSAVCSADECCALQPASARDKKERGLRAFELPAEGRLSTLLSHVDQARWGQQWVKERPLKLNAAGQLRICDASPG
jgi:hypothetical protein